MIGIEWEPGVLAGFATWGPFRPRATYKYSAEHSVYVAEQFRGEGVGRQLMQAIIGEAKNKDLHMLIAGIDATWPISCRRRGSTGIATTGCLHPTTSSGGPSRRWQSGGDWLVFRRNRCRSPFAGQEGQAPTATQPEPVPPTIRHGLPGPS